MWLKVAVFTSVVAFAVADEIRSSERLQQVVHTPVEHHRGKLLLNPQDLITRKSVVDRRTCGVFVNKFKLRVVHKRFHTKGVDFTSFFQVDIDISFYHGFLASLSVIIVSELGDKTWFIAVILAMRHSRLTVFSGAMSALALMTVLSACLGWMSQLIPRVLTYYASTILFALFGLKMIHEGYHMSASEGQEDFEEAQAEVTKREIDHDAGKFVDMEAGVSGRASSYSSAWLIFSFVSHIFIEAFTMTFLAEWGDRSQLTTIILAARENIAGVISGGILGHTLCTGIAVVGGKLVAQRLSVRTVTLVGGVVFLIFALSAFFVNDVEEKPLRVDYS